METVVAAFQRVYASSAFDGVALTLTVILIAATLALWLTDLARAWRHGRWLQSLENVTLGILIEAVIAQPVLSLAGLYTPGVALMSQAVMVIAFALLAAIVWRRWRRPIGEPRGWRIARMALMVAFLALGLIQAYIPSTLPRPI